MSTKEDTRRATVLDSYEELIRRKVEEDRSGSKAVLDRRHSTVSTASTSSRRSTVSTASQRSTVSAEHVAEEDKNKSGKGRGGALWERIRHKVEEDKKRSGRGYQPPVLSAVEAFQENIRRKLERDGGGSGGNGGSEHGKAERGNARRKLLREDRSVSMPVSSRSSAVSEFEERLRLKTNGGGGGCRGDNGGFEHGMAARVNARRKLQREDRSASMFIKSPTSMVNDFEEKIRRKLERDGGGGSGGNGGSMHGKADHGKARRETFSASMPVLSMADDSDEENGNLQLARRDARPGGQLASSFPKDLGSLEADEEAAEFLDEGIADGDADGDGNDGGESIVKYNRQHSLDGGIGEGVQTPPTAAYKEASSEASGVGFEEILTHLLRYKEKNGNVTMPASHPSYTHILNTLSSLGMEESLRKHWDQQLAGLMAFKERYGDCLVPEAHSTLGMWARVQRDHYIMYTMRLPSPLTRDRFNRLKDVGFDEFVRWEQQDPKLGKGSVGWISSESEEEEASIDPDDLTLNQKSKGERALIARHSSSQNKKGREKLVGKAAVAEEMYQKRVLLRASRKGLGLKASQVIAQTINEEILLGGSDGDPSTSPSRGKADLRGSFAGLKNSLVFSSSSSNLCPGSWECTKCTYINEPVGLGAKVAVCRACGAWKCPTCTYVNEATSSHCTACNDQRENGEGRDGRGAEGGSDRPTCASARSRDDSAIDSWRPFGDETLQLVMAQSMADLGVCQAERQSMADLEIHRAEVPIVARSSSMPLSMDFNQQLLDHADSGATGKKTKKEKTRKKKRRSRKEKRGRKKEGAQDLDNIGQGHMSMLSLGLEKF